MLALKTLKSFNLLRTLFVPLLVSVLAASGVALGQTTATKNATIEEIRAFFKGKQKTVLTFVGYSGAGYQDEAGMRQQAEGILGDYDPAKTIINIGATPDGIGAIYEIAKHKGFVTTGIVSSQAKRYNAKLSPYVDHAFYVEDETWVDS